MSRPAPFVRRGLAAFALALLAPVALLADHHEKKDDAKETKTVEVKADALTLTVPEDWKRGEPSNRLRLAEFVPPKPEGVTDDAEVTVFGGFGGTDEANLQRWIDQFAADGREVKLVRGESREGAYKLLDATGTWNAPVGPPMMRKTEPKPGSRMLAAIVAVEGRGNYFLKLTGPAETVTAQADAFRNSFGAKKESEKPFELK